jgi:hypothetical protein
MNILEQSKKVSTAILTHVKKEGIHEEEVSAAGLQHQTCEVRVQLSFLAST